MSDQGIHCPFLNRSDARCSNSFNLEHLDHAFRFCFDRYQQCPVYLELLVERRIRRLTGTCVEREHRDGTAPLVQITFHGRTSAPAPDRHHQHAA